MKEISKKSSIELKVEPIPDELACPALEVGRRRQIPLLLGSFAGALGSAAGICGCLASILITYQLITPDTVDSPMLTVVSNPNSENLPHLESEQNPLNAPPPRLATIPTPPSSVTIFHTPPREDPPTTVEIPNIEVEPIDLVVLEEISLDNPFAREPKKKAPASEPAKTSQRKSAKKSALQKKRMAAQQAARGKKMAKSARLVSRASLVYPRDARRKKVQGRTVITVTIGNNGRVLDGFVSQSSGNSSLDQAALRAARKYRFTAAINALGQAMKSLKKIPFDFHLQ